MAEANPETVRAWQKAHPENMRIANKRYYYDNWEKVKKAKRTWWRKHKGSYGSREEYRRAMKRTRGVGFSSSTE
jgi:hypothetical protein